MNRLHVATGLCGWAACAEKLRVALARRFEHRFFERIPIYVFHRVRPLDGTLDPLGLRVSPEAFAASLQKLRERHTLHFVDDLVKGRFSGRTGRDAALTFDDGYADFLLHAFPVIERLRVPVTVFLTTSFVGTDRLLWWDELLELSRRPGWPAEEDFFRSAQRLKFLSRPQIDSLLCSRYGGNGDFAPEFRAANRGLTWDEVRRLRESGLVRFEPHGHAHVNYGSSNDEETRADITRCMDRLEVETGRRGEVLAYPYGGIDDIRPETPAVVCACGIKAAFL
ncbi:MAG: polysaccharide deacetylase family protein, partial [Planctomycetes bacterium]|nr:polysaccharide deacetylase family protein [Planctomycetota bacterium]